MEMISECVLYSDPSISVLRWGHLGTGSRDVPDCRMGRPISQRHLSQMGRYTIVIRGLRRRLRAQAGFALPMVIGISLVLGITGTTAMVYSTQNVKSASSSKADERAFSLAEGGLNYAYATLYNAQDPTMPGAVPVRSETVENGTITWWGTLDTQTNTWTLTGRGSLPNPAGGMPVIRTARGRARLQTVEVGDAN